MINCEPSDQPNNYELELTFLNRRYVSGRARGTRIQWGGDERMSRLTPDMERGKDTHPRYRSPTVGWKLCSGAEGNPMLSRAYEQLSSINSEVMDPNNWGNTSILYLRGSACITLSKTNRLGRQTQLLVPQKYYQPIRQLMHDIPYTGHLWREQALSQVLACFRWSGVHEEVRLCR